MSTSNPGPQPKKKRSPAKARQQLWLDRTLWDQAGNVLDAQGRNRTEAIATYLAWLTGDPEAILPTPAVRTTDATNRAVAARAAATRGAKAIAQARAAARENTDATPAPVTSAPKRLRALTISQLIKTRTGFRPQRSEDRHSGEDGIWVSGDDRPGNTVRVLVVGREADTDLLATVDAIADALADTYTVTPVGPLDDTTQRITLLIHWR